MKSNTSESQRCGQLLVGCLAAATLGVSTLATASPVTVVHDTFEIGATAGTSPGTVGNDAGDELDIPWYKVGNSSATVGVSSSSRLGSSYVLNYQPYGVSRPAVGTLYNADLPVNSVTLGPNEGDFIKLSIRYHSTRLGDMPDLFAFGLYNSNGTPTAANVDTSSYDDFGYGARFAIGASDSTPVAEIFKEAGGKGTPTFGNDITVLTPANSTGVLVSTTDANSTYLAELILTRQSGGIQLDFNFYRLYPASGNTILLGGATGVLETSNLFETFDEIVIGNGNGDSGSNSARSFLDDVQIVASVVPEPGTLTLLGASALLLGTRRQRADR